MIWIATLITMVVVGVLTVGLAPRRRGQEAQSLRKLMHGLGGLNLGLALAVAGLGLAWLFAPGTVRAAGLAQEATGDPYATIAAALAVSVGSVGAAYAVGATGSAAIGTIAERPETFGRALIFVGLSEGIAIYGLIIAFMILGR